MLHFLQNYVAHPIVFFPVYVIKISFFVCSKNEGFLYSILTVETCDVRTIPVVDHATFELNRFIDATDNPMLLAQNFTIPNYVNVTYTCEKGYRLQDPNNNMIGCKYVTTLRKFSNGSIHETVVAEAVWKSAEGIVCKYGEEAIKSEVHYVGVYIRKNLVTQFYPNI